MGRPSQQRTIFRISKSQKEIFHLTCGHAWAYRPSKTWRRVSFEYSMRFHLTHGIRVCRLHVTFIDKEGDEHKFEVALGDNLLDIAQSQELEMEGVTGP